VNEPFEILHCEDNHGHAIIISRILTQIAPQIQVVNVPDGKAGLDYIHLRKHPDLILLDLRMPRMDGLQVLQHLKSNEKTSHIPVVFLTTSSNEADQAEAKRLNADRYLIKPLDYNALETLLKDMVFQWCKPT